MLVNLEENLNVVEFVPREVVIKDCSLNGLIHFNDN